MNVDEHVTKWIAFVLPPVAAHTLVLAAKRAEQYEPDSLARKLCIDEAIKKVRADYPEYFRRS